MLFIYLLQLRTVPNFSKHKYNVVAGYSNILWLLLQLATTKDTEINIFCTSFDIFALLSSLTSLDKRLNSTQNGVDLHLHQVREFCAECRLLTCGEMKPEVLLLYVIIFVVISL